MRKMDIYPQSANSVDGGWFNDWTTSQTIMITVRTLHTILISVIATVIMIKYDGWFENVTTMVKHLMCVASDFGFHKEYAIILNTVVCVLGCGLFQILLWYKYGLHRVTHSENRNYFFFPREESKNNNFTLSDKQTHNDKQTQTVRNELPTPVVNPTGGCNIQTKTKTTRLRKPILRHVSSMTTNTAYSAADDDDDDFKIGSSGEHNIKITTNKNLASDIFDEVDNNHIMDSDILEKRVDLEKDSTLVFSDTEDE